jgi:hypothetical protein
MYISPAQLNQAACPAMCTNGALSYRYLATGAGSLLEGSSTSHTLPCNSHPPLQHVHMPLLPAMCTDGAPSDHMPPPPHILVPCRWQRQHQQHPAPQHPSTSSAQHDHCTGPHQAHLYHTSLLGHVHRWCTGPPAPHHHYTPPGHPVPVASCTWQKPQPSPQPLCPPFAT